MGRFPPASKARSQNGKAKATLIADDDLDILGEDEWQGTATEHLGHELGDDGDGNDEGEKNDDYYEMEAGSGEDEQEGYEED